MAWPEGLSKPEFMTHEYGKTTGERASRVRDACSFELRPSLFADDCVRLFQSRNDLIRGSSHIFAHLRKFGLCMHVDRGNAASKTEAMYCPPPRMAYEAVDTSRFYTDCTGFIEFCENFGFLGTSGHRQMMNPSVMNLQHRLVLELSVGLSFDQRQAQWRIDLFW